MEPLFELPLKNEHGSVIDTNGATVAFGYGVSAATDRAAHIVLCVNAFPKLVEACEAVVHPHGHHVIVAVNKCRAALLLADPAMDAVCDGLAKDAGLELTE